MLRQSPIAALRRERGTVLLLFPAAVLVMIVLGAIVIDVGLTQVRARELDMVAASAANDALGALDLVELRSTGDVRLDPGRARSLVGESVAAGPLPRARVVAVAMTNGPLGPSIAVTLQLEVRFVMARALPGGLDTTTITRTATVSVLG